MHFYAPTKLYVAMYTLPQVHIGKSAWEPPRPPQPRALGEAKPSQAANSPHRIAMHFICHLNAHIHLCIWNTQSQIMCIRSNEFPMAWPRPKNGNKNAASSPPHKITMHFYAPSECIWQHVLNYVGPIIVCRYNIMERKMRCGKERKRLSPCISTCYRNARR